MTTVLTAGLAWMVLAPAVAVIIGRAVRLVDEAVQSPSTTDAIERYLAERAPAPLT